MNSSSFFWFQAELTENCSFHAKLTSSSTKKYADFKDAKFSSESCLSKLLTMWFNSVRDCLVVVWVEENVYKYSVCVCVCGGGGRGARAQRVMNCCCLVEVGVGWGELEGEREEGGGGREIGLDAECTCSAVERSEQTCLGSLCNQI